MNSDDIIGMAKEAGVQFYPSPTNDVRLCLMANLERFARFVASAAYEECAKVCDEFSEHYWAKDDAVESVIYEECATAIRERAQKIVNGG